MSGSAFTKIGCAVAKSLLCLRHRLRSRPRMDGQAVMCTRDKEFAIRDIGDCLARGYDRTGFSEVDTGGQRAWTAQLAKSSDQSVRKPAPPGGPVSGAPSGGCGALPLSGGTPAIVLPPGRAGSAPSLPTSGAGTQ